MVAKKGYWGERIDKPGFIAAGESAEFNRTDNMQANDQPFIVIWETTRACDLACVHCRASAQPRRSPLELSTVEGESLIRQVRELRVPVFVLTGGDPLKRPDIFDLVEYSTRIGVRVSLSPSVTPLLTREALEQLKDRGLARLALSLDGSTPEIHDRFRGVPGSYTRTMQAIDWVHKVGLPLQINSSMSRHNLADFDALAQLLERIDPVLWSVFFLVPTGRGRLGDVLSGEECERLFAQLYDLSRRVNFDVKTTEAMHYRRYLIQRRVREKQSSVRMPPPVEARRWLRLSAFAQCGRDGIPRASRGINDAKGFVFVSHTGEVYPSGFLPLSGGNIRKQSLSKIYQKSPLFVALREAENLRGKCRVCEFREICGGSRARAYALTGDAFASEPCCVYWPKGWHGESGAR
jgi:radical SAM protein